MPMNSKVLIAIGGIALIVFAGAVTWRYWPEPIPKFQVKDEAGQAVPYEELFQGKDYLLIVFLLPNCSISQFASGVVNDQFQQFSDRMAFAGLIFGNYANGQKYANQENLLYPVFGLKDSPDPFAVNELIRVIGSDDLVGTAVYGGTVVVVDRDGDIVFQLEKEDVKELPRRLGSTSP